MMHSRSLLLIILMLALFLGCSACGKKKENSGNAGPNQVETLPDFQNPLLGFVKVAPPKVLAEKVSQLAGQLDPSGQSAAMLPMFLGGYGYPAFPGVSDTTPVTLFLLLPEEEEEPSFLLFLKATSDAVLAAQLKALPNSVQREAGEYIIFAQDEASLEMMVDEKELAQLADGNNKYDLQLTLLPNGLVENRPKILEGIQADLEADESMPPEFKPWIMATLQTFFDEADSAKSLDVGINLNPEAVTVGLDMVALAGTPMGVMFSQESQGRTTGGDYIPSDFSFAMVGDFDPKATREYFNSIYANFLGYTPEEGQASLAEFKSLMDPYFEKTDGIFGAGIDWNQLSTVQLQHVKGEYTQEQMDQFYGFFADTLIPALIPLGEDGEAMISASYEANAGTIGGQPYSRYINNFNFEAEEGEPFPAGMETLSEQVLFFTLHDGDLLIASQLDSLETLLLAVKAGTPLDDAISKDFLPRPGMVFQGSLNLVSYYRNLFQGMGEAGLDPDGQMEGILSLLDQMEAQNLPNTRYEITTGDNRMVGSYIIPIKTLQAAVNAAMTIRMQQAAPGGM